MTREPTEDEVERAVSVYATQYPGAVVSGATLEIVRGMLLAAMNPPSGAQIEVTDEMRKAGIKSVSEFPAMVKFDTMNIARSAVAVIYRAMFAARPKKDAVDPSNGDGRGHFRVGDMRVRMHRRSVSRTDEVFSHGRRSDKTHNGTVHVQTFRFHRRQDDPK